MFFQLMSSQVWLVGVWVWCRCGCGCGCWVLGWCVDGMGVGVATSWRSRRPFASFGWAGIFYRRQGPGLEASTVDAPRALWHSIMCPCVSLLEKFEVEPTQQPASPALAPPMLVTGEFLRTAALGIKKNKNSWHARRFPTRPSSGPAALGRQRRQGLETPVSAPGPPTARRTLRLCT